MQDITNKANNDICVNFPGLLALLDFAPRNNYVVGEWSTSPFDSVFLLSQCTGFCFDGFPVLKVVAIHQDLQFNIKIGGTELSKADLSLVLPDKLHSLASLLSLLQTVSALKFCTGSSNSSHGFTDREVTNSSGKCIGERKAVSMVGTANHSTNYFSSSCHVFLPPCNLAFQRKVCDKCNQLADILRCRCNRGASTEGDRQSKCTFRHQMYFHQMAHVHIQRPSLDKMGIICSQVQFSILWHAEG